MTYAMAGWIHRSGNAATRCECGHGGCECGHCGQSCASIGMVEPAAPAPTVDPWGPWADFETKGSIEHDWVMGGVAADSEARSPIPLAVAAAARESGGWSAEYSGATTLPVTSGEVAGAFDAGEFGSEVREVAKHGGLDAGAEVRNQILVNLAGCIADMTNWATSISPLAIACKEASRFAENGITDWCIRGVCQKNGTFVCGWYTGVHVFQCGCLENWRVLPRGEHPRSTAWASCDEGGDIAREARLLEQGFYGVDQCYVVRDPRSGCKCKCWRQNVVVPYEPGWATDCRTNGGAWLFDNPNVWDAP